MERMSDDVLLEELNKRFLDNKKALQAMKVMNEKIEKLNVKLGESERLKTNFLSNIRNEINNPLTTILGMARELAGPMKDENMRLLMASMIYNEAFDLDFQLKNIFMAAELEAGEATLSKAQVDVIALTRSVISSFSHKAQEKKLTIDFADQGSQQDDQRLLFSTDPGKLRLVFANLVANAIEFSHAGTNVSIELRKENNSLHVSIADKGIGIPDQERERLFERFHQLDGGSCKKHKGHGLGLSITKALAEILGGKVFVAQAPGGGTLFRVVIPESPDDGDRVFSEDGNEFLFESGKAF